MIYTIFYVLRIEKGHLAQQATPCCFPHRWFPVHSLYTPFFSLSNTYWLSYLTDSVIFCSRVVTQKIFFHCKTKGHTSENVSYILVFKCCLEEEDILKLKVIYFRWNFLSLNTLAQGIYTLHICSVYIHIPRGSVGKKSIHNAGDLGSIPGWEDALEKRMATHSNILALRIPQTVYIYIYSPWSCNESDITEWLSLSFFLHIQFLVLYRINVHPTWNMNVFVYKCIHTLAHKTLSLSLSHTHTHTLILTCTHTHSTKPGWNIRLIWQGSIFFWDWLPQTQ